MSLSVHAFIRDASGKMIFLDEPHEYLAAGFESWRTEVWGSPQVRGLGAEFFPRLAAGDLYIEAGEVLRFRSECALLREHLGALASGWTCPPRGHLAVDTASGQVIDPSASREVLRAQISLRLANIEEAIRQALEADGGVVIW